MMNAITPNDAVSDAAILRAAEALVARLGPDAAAEAANRAGAGRPLARTRCGFARADCRRAPAGVPTMNKEER